MIAYPAKITMKGRMNFAQNVMNFWNMQRCV
jgi:hypothetical protein